MELNDRQLEAVQYTGKYLLVNAGPGSGKTRVIIERVKWMLNKGIDPYSILLLTFTNYAANVMKSRIDESSPSSYIRACTFHSFCYSLLKDYLDGDKRKFTVIDDDDQKRIVNDIAEGKVNAGNVVEHINLCKSIDASGNYDQYAAIINKYNQHLLEHSLMDFGDLQIRALEYIKDTNYKHIFIDEFHDTSPIQLDIVKELERNCSTLTIVCDEQQSIYGWRGANIDNILLIKELYPSTSIITLNRNYRSTKAIVKSVNNLISYTDEKLCDKDLYSERKYGKDIVITECENEDTEAELVAKRIKTIYDHTGRYDNNMVLFRTNSQSRAIEYALMKAGIPYRLVAATSFYKRKEVKDIIAYLKFIVNDMDEQSALRIINTPKRAIGKTTVEKLIDKYGSLTQAIKGITSPSKEDIKIYNFKLMVNPLRQASTSEGIGNLMKNVIDTTKYIKHLEEENSNEARDRISNLDSMIGNAMTLQDKYNYKIDDYLAMVSLCSDIDSMSDSGNVNIMTIHASKGLECKYVHIVGVENNVIPHAHGELNEERRLMYVGVSRGMDMVMITYCKRRVINGKFLFTGRSMFIDQLLTVKEE
jgi:DNA helicase II / ATP-dependent DNA helicase PcrA